MSISSQIVDQRVIRIAQEQEEAFLSEVGIKNDPEKLKSASFLFLVVKTLMELADDEVIDGIVEGGQDFGVDAIYASAPQDGEFVVTVFQSKYKQNLDNNSNFPEGGVTKLIEAIGALFDPGITVTLNPRLKAKIEDIRSLVADGALPRVNAILCNNGIIWTSAAQQRIDAAHFGDQVSWQHVGPDDLVALMQAAKVVNDTIQLSGKAIVESFDFRRALIGRVAVGQLAALFERHGDRLLERNIRRFLGLSGNRVNEGVAMTLRTPSQRPNFYFYNNGITVLCSKFRHNALQQENWQVQLDGLQIVNGGQTSRTVQQVVKEVGPDAGNAFVLIRIYEVAEDDDELVRNITYATNSQNPVDLRDLKSNDDRQKNLALALGELGFTYRLKRGEVAPSEKDLTSTSVAEAVLAVWRWRPHQARFMANEHFGKLYDVIFTKDLNAAQAASAALLLRLAENRRKRPPADAPDFLPYASRFVAMLMGKYLLEDLKLELPKLNHTNFQEAVKLIEAKGETYFQRSLKEIAEALNALFPPDQPRTLQRLSATFRRADLIEWFKGAPIAADVLLA